MCTDVDSLRGAVSVSERTEVGLLWWLFGLVVQISINRVVRTHEHTGAAACGAFYVQVLHCLMVVNP